MTGHHPLWDLGHGPNCLAHGRRHEAQVRCPGGPFRADGQVLASGDGRKHRPVGLWGPGAGLPRLGARRERPADAEAMGKRWGGADLGGAALDARAKAHRPARTPRCSARGWGACGWCADGPGGPVFSGPEAPDDKVMPAHRPDLEPPNQFRPAREAAGRKGLAGAGARASSRSCARGHQRRG